MPHTFIVYQHWVNFKAGEKSWLTDEYDIDVRLLKRVKAYVINDTFELTEQEGYEVNTWFQSDCIPLSGVEIEHGVFVADGLAPAEFSGFGGKYSTGIKREKFCRVRWIILGILNHICGAEWWYLSRLGLTDLTRNEVPKDPFERLEMI